MLHPETLRYIKDLKNNNNKPWFEDNRNRYEAAKTDFALFAGKLIEGLSSFEPTLGNLQVKDCTYRINRDIRFSKDKTPYKSHMGAFFSIRGKKANAAGYYFHMEPGKSKAGGGFYMPEAADLSRIRQEIDYNLDEWKKIVESRSFMNCFTEGVDGIETLSRPPKGYEAGNPAIEYLKMKSFVVTRPISNTDLSGKGLLKETLKTFETMQPFIEFLNRSVSE